MKNLLLGAALWAASFTAQATTVTSYLLIQGPFGQAEALETHQWKITYDSGQLSTGQDLLNAVFGTPVANGFYTDGFMGVWPYFSAGAAGQSAGYIKFDASPRLFAESFTLHGTKVAQDPYYDPGWNYYVAGGAVASGNWLYSDVGTVDREIADGSFDGFVFGPTFPAAPIEGANSAPLAANFAGGSLLKKDSGTTILTGSQNYATLTTSAGATNLQTLLGTGTSTINANATLNIAVGQTLAALNIGAGAVVTFGGPPADGVFAGSAKVLPEPGAAMLLVFGAAGLAQKRRRVVQPR